MMKRLGWAIWAFCLLVGPIGYLYVAMAYPDIPSYPPPWPQERSEPHRLAEALMWTHMILSGIAFVATPFLTRSWLVIVGAWFGIVFLAFMMFLVIIDLILAKSGMYF